MKRQYRFLILAVLLASLLGFLLPWLVSLLQDYRETRRVETYAVDAISINYDTNLTVAEKLALFPGHYLYCSRLDNGRYLIDSEVSEITSEFFEEAFGQVIDDFGMPVCSPTQAYTEENITLILWESRLEFKDGLAVFLVDDATGAILSFSLYLSHDSMERCRLAVSELTLEAIVSQAAEALAENLGMAKVWVNNLYTNPEVYLRDYDDLIHICQLTCKVEPDTIWICFNPASYMEGIGSADDYTFGSGLAD